MKFEVNIYKKFAFVILGAILVLAGAIYGYAQSPSIFGHEFEELEGVQRKLTNECPGEKAIKRIDPDTGEVICVQLLDGPQGPQGSQGSQGPQGYQGYRGPTGPSGSSASNAVCTISNAVYSTGDTCYSGTCNPTCSWFRCRSNGAWDSYYSSPPVGSSYC